MARIIEINNRVYLFGKVRSKTAKEMVKELHHILETCSGSIAIFIDNTGGFCTNGFTIHDTIESIKDREVHVIVCGSAQSAALLAVLAVPYERRWCHVNSTFMAHRIRVDEVSGTHAYLGKHVEQLSLYTHKYCDIIASKTLMTREEAKSKFFDDDNENAFYAKEAKKLGFVHRIITDYRCFRWVESVKGRPLKSPPVEEVYDSGYVNHSRGRAK